MNGSKPTSDTQGALGHEILPLSRWGKLPVRALVRLRREVPIRRALRNVSLGYAETADERMREVGCYD